MIASSCITLINVIDGEDGISILSIDEQFSKSNSQDTAPTTNWTDLLPQRNEGEILWKHEVVRYSDSTIKILSPHPITGDKGDIGASGEISIGLGYKVNHTSLTSSNNGEIFAHGFTDGVAANINGWIYFESIRYTVLVGYLNPGTVYNTFPYVSYIGIRKSSPSKIVAIRFNNSTKTFLFVDCENNYLGQVDETDWIIIGDFKMTNSEMIEYANFYNGGKSLQAIKEEELLESGKLVIDWSANTINIKALNNRGFISFNGNRLFLQSTSKTFSKKGEGLILANLNTDSILFSKIELGDTVYNNQNVKTINFLDYESLNVITTRHDVLIDYGYIKIGEFIIDDSGVVKTAAITESEPIESYLQKAFMKLFKMGNITSSNFEDWLDAIDLKNFYQTLVVSTLFVNSLLANDGQFLNSLKITSNNIDGTLNNSIDKQELFKSGLVLTQDGNINGNFNKELGTGWKIDGDGKATFYKADLIDINVEGMLTANHIDHNSLKTFDSKTSTIVSKTSIKNEWFSDIYFASSNLSENVITFDGSAIVDGSLYDKYVNYNGLTKYIHSVTNIVISGISHGTTRTLYSWTNNTGHWVLVEFQILGEYGWTCNLYYRTRNVNMDCSHGDTVRLLVAPNETVEPKFEVGGLWGSGTGTVAFFYVHNFYNKNTALMEFANINKNYNLAQINCESNAAPAINDLQNIVVPNWANYLFIEIYSSSNSFPYQFLLNKNSASTFEVITPIKTLRNIWFFAIPINNKDLLIQVQRNEIRKYDSDDDYDYSYYKSVSIETIRIAYGINNSKGYNLINTSNGISKEFSQSTYYKNTISVNSISVVCTKINTAAFIDQLQNAFGDNKNKWLIINKGLTYYLKINEILYTDFSQVLLTTSNLQLIKNDGSLVNALPDTRYDSLEIKLTPYAQTEHVKTGDLIPNNSSANIGEVNNEYLTARVKTVFATELHGKVYAS